MRRSILTLLALFISVPQTAGAEPPASLVFDAAAPSPSSVMGSTTAAQASDSPTAQAVAVLAQFTHEPSVLEVQEEASRYALVHPAIYDTWLSRASWSNVLPERLTGEIQHTIDDDVNVRTAALSTSDSITETLDSDAQLRFKVFAEWDLSRLVFDQDEYNAAKELSKIVTRREDLLTTINKLYFARRQLQAMALLTPVMTAKKAIKQELQLAGLTADLDALTGGWFSEEVARAEEFRAVDVQPQP